MKKGLQVFDRRVIKFVCLECGAPLEAEPGSAGLRIECPSCRAETIVPRPALPRLAADATTRRTPEEPEQAFYDEHPVMFGHHPFGFLGSVLLIGAFGLGLLLLAVWWLRTRAVRLTITNRRTILRRGLLSKLVTEVWHEDVRNVQVRQRLLERLASVGSLAVSSAGQDGFEIQADGMPDPQRAKAIIDEYRLIPTAVAAPGAAQTV